MTSCSEHLDYDTKGMAAYQAPHLFQPTKLRQALRDAHEGRIPPLVAYFSAAPLSRTISQFGADIVLLDWEHAAMSVETITTYCHEIQFMSGGQSVPVVRLPNHDHANIGWALDAGASIMVPQIETVEQAQKVVAATKFGTTSKHLARSAPPARFMVGVTDSAADSRESFWYNQNRQAAVIIQMESVRGANNLDDILTAVGKDIDCVFLGSLDMRIDMGLETGWGPEQSYLDIVEKLRTTCKKHDVPFANPVLGGNWDRVEGRAFGSVGFDLMTLWQDRNKVQQARSVFKAHLAESKAKLQVVENDKVDAEKVNAEHANAQRIQRSKARGETGNVDGFSGEVVKNSNELLNVDRLGRLVHVH